MAIATCPSCSKSISSKHQVCPHCDVKLGDVSEEDRNRMASRRKAKRQQSLLNYSFVSLILVLGGFLYIYSKQPAPGSTEMLLCRIAIGIGALWYLINRALLVVLKKKK
ncbi:hypothetical protein ACSLBF_10000 [Pseudoalteromonas sp. T1lg65]|uniref:hypothetical protein n=1 Tax=Pseudoalteromonas sp. T1lg65 TaxID=2077101 RepID=UPI003F78CB95